MIKIYFRQALEMLRQNMFISSIAILGTALAIMMIMAILVSDEIRNISLKPEINRNRTFYIPFQTERDTIKHSMNTGQIRYSIYRDYLSDLKVPEQTSLMSTEKSVVNRWASKEMYIEDIKYTDMGFWSIFSFTFLEGLPFSPADVESGLKNAVIRKSIRQKLFKSEEALGEIIEINFEPYRIVGIVDDFSPVFTAADASIWVPYTSKKDYENIWFTFLLLAKNKNDYPEMEKEIRSAEQQYNTLHSPTLLSLRGPDNHKIHSMDIRASTNEQTASNLKSRTYKSIFIFVVLLLVPAINLSGLSLSRIKRRMAEIGVRKAFGAKRYTILLQVLYENLVTSLIGGVIGLLLSYLVVYQMKEWLLNLPAESAIPVGALISWPVFIGVFAVCVLLNLLSAGIPAYQASRLPIINSLTQNDK